MQNAKYHHVQQAKGFNPPLNVMFIVEHPEWGSIKAHIKSVLLEVNKFVGLNMESAGGSKFFAEYEWLKPVPRERGSQPKAKRKPQKGTKPWLSNCVQYDPSLIHEGAKVITRNGEQHIVTYESKCNTNWVLYYHNSCFDINTGKNLYNYEDVDIVKIVVDLVDYDSKLIAPGVKVMCRDKKVRVVIEIEHFDDGEHIINFSDGQTAFLHSGKANYGDRPWGSDIMKILVEKKIEKPVNDKYCGYAPDVWHFWQGKSSTPVDSEVYVHVWLRKDVAGDRLPYYAGAYQWQWNEEYHDADIIAFKISGTQIKS